MPKYIWKIAKELFEWTPNGVNYTNESLMKHVNAVFLGTRKSNLKDDQRSPMWDMEDGFDTPEKFAVLLAKSFGWNISLKVAPGSFEKWHRKNAEPYYINDCTGAEPE